MAVGGCVRNASLLNCVRVCPVLYLMQIRGLFSLVVDLLLLYGLIFRISPFSEMHRRKSPLLWTYFLFRPATASSLLSYNGKSPLGAVHSSATSTATLRAPEGASTTSTTST